MNVVRFYVDILKQLLVYTVAMSLLTQLLNVTLNVSHIKDHQVLGYQPVSIEIIYVEGILI